MKNESQLLVYIDAELKKEVQKKAIDTDLSLKDLVINALKMYLEFTDL